MRAVICGDTHIGAIYGLGRSLPNGRNSRLDDYEKTLNHIVDYAIETKADMFIQTGDAFDSRNPSSEHINIFNKALKKLSMADISSFIIMGNHDYKRKGETFTSAISLLAENDYPNIRIVLEPELVTLKKGSDDGVNLLLLPFRDRRMYGGTSTEEDSLLYEKEALSILEGKDDNLPTMAIGHNFYHEFSYKEYGGAEVLIRPSVFKSCDMIAMGHYHQFKIVSRKDPVAFYTGSMDKLNFGDETIDKFFIDYDSKNKKTKVLKAPVRALKDIKIDLSKVDKDIIPAIKSEISNFDLEDKIVRLKVSIKDSLLGFVKTKTLKEMLYNSGAFYVSRIIVEPVFTRIVRDSSILKSKSDYDKFKAFIELQKDLEDEHKASILEEAQRVML